MLKPVENIETKCKISARAKGVLMSTHCSPLLLFPWILSSGDLGGLKPAEDGSLWC